MFALVVFEDGVYYICKETDIIKKKELCSIRYKGSGRYAGKIIALNDKKEELITLKTQLETDRDSGEEVPSAECASSAKSTRSKKPPQKKTDLSKKQKKKKRRFNDAAAGHTRTVEIDSVDILTKKPTSLEYDRTQSIVIGSARSLNILPSGMVVAELEKDKAMTLPLATDNKQTSTDVDLTRSHDPRSTTQRVCFSSNSELKNNNMIENPREINNELTGNDNVLSPDEENNQLLRTVLTDTACKEPRQNEEHEMCSSTNHQHSNLSVNQMASNTSFKTVPTILTRGISEHSGGLENSTILNVSPISLTELTVPMDVSGLSTVFSDNTVWNWNNVAIDVYESESPLQKQNDKEDQNREVEVLIPNSGISEDVNQFTNTVPSECNLSNEENENCSDVASNISSGSSFVPDSQSSDDSIEGQKEQSVAEKNKEFMTSENISMDLDASLKVNKVGHSAPDDTEMFIKTVESGIKKDFCIFCKTEQGKLSRHVVRKHKNEEDVVQFQSFEKGSDERKKIMEKIRKRGQFYFNTDRAINNGERKVTRRPNAKYKKLATDFATCPSCFADYAKTSLRHHYRKCAKKNSAKRRLIMASSKMIVGRIHSKACDILRKRVFPTMQDDNIVKTIRYDELVILFGNKLCQKYKDPHFYDMIRQKLRQLGRFLLEVKTHDSEIHDFFSLFYPKRYDVTIAAIQALAGVNDSGTGFKIPSLATSLGTLIKQIGKLCVSEFIKRHNKERQTYAEDFLKLLTEDYTSSVARTALETLSRNKRQSTVVLPSTQDIYKLQVYLRDKLKKNYELLNEGFSRKAWNGLAESALISIQLFNRRRAGEIERIFIEDFRNYQKIDEKTIGESYTKFSIEEKQAVQKYVRFTIRGKLNRTVPVLLHREMLVCLELLLKNRHLAKVNLKNPYLFGIPGTLKGDYKYLRACELMRKSAEECGASKPSTLRGTILRKHVATMCVNFNLSENEVSELANFLGHADRIHKEHYRQPIIVREILHVSKLLEAVEGKEVEFDEDSDENNDGIGVSGADVAVPNENIDNGNTTTASSLDSPQPKTKKQKKKRSTSPFGKCNRVRWCEKEKEVALRAFHNNITTKTLPSFQQIQQVIDANPKVFNRNIASIKSWISNQIKKH